MNRTRPIDLDKALAATSARQPQIILIDAALPEGLTARSLSTSIRKSRSWRSLSWKQRPT